MANTITIVRIICSIALLFYAPFSLPFYILYITAGLTDMIDGTVARKTGTVSELGSKFDTIADFVLVITCLIKLIPVLDIETWMYIWIMIIAEIKLINIVSGFVRYKRMIAVHSVLNRITGSMLFVLPLSVCFIELHYTVLIVCATATIAAIDEGYEIYSEIQYD